MEKVQPTLAELFQAHRRGLAGAVRTVLGPAADVPEVLQDAFLKAWRAWSDGKRPDDPVAWVFVIVWNAARDARRRQQRRPAHEPFDEEHAVATTRPTDHPSPALALERRETVQHAQAAVARLSDDDQQVFLLRVAGELSFDAVAAALHIPVGTAKTRMRRALMQLRRSLCEAQPAMPRTDRNQNPSEEDPR